MVAPTTQPTHGLGVLGIHASEYEPGFLTSGNTRRAGYVLLTDLTPTIANLAGVELDEASMEGRAVERRDGPATGAARRAELVDAEAAARFRDRVLYPVVMTVVISVGLLALAAAAVLISGWDDVRPWLARVALVLLAFPSLTYLAAVFPFYEWGVAAYWLFLVLGSLLVGVLASMFAGRWLGPLAVGYGLLVGVVTVSIVGLGSRLQLATVFGDSPIVAGRFTGINNVTFAYYFLSATMLACIVGRPHPRSTRTQPDARDPRRRAPDRRRHPCGGPTSAVRWRACRRSPSSRWAWGSGRCGGGWWCWPPSPPLVLIVALGALDLTRDSADRSHLGRLFERIGSDGWSGLSTVVERKLAVNLRSLTESTWRYLFGPLAIAAGLMLWRGRGWVRAVADAFPPLRRAMPGLIALAVLGYGANDSGIAVPGAMLAVAVPGFVYLACRVEPTPAREGSA